MKLGYELNVEQTQKLAMTPELIQAIRILQFNNQELKEYIQNELLENPILEAEMPKSYDTEINIDELREKIIESNYSVEAYKQWDIAKEEIRDFSYEQYVAFRVSLTEHLLVQLHFSNLKGKDSELGRYLIECIDDNGYLSMSEEEIAASMNAEKEDIERVLSVIQTFDPTGVGARNLRECLCIQLEARGEIDKNIEFIIKNRLEELADNKISQIAKELGLGLSEVQAIADKIKALEPKPGRLYDSDQTVKYVVPDIIVEKQDGEYTVISNEGDVPHLMVSSYYNKMSAEAGKDEELKKYLNERFNSAVWLMRSIEQRKKTIYNVASAIIKYQQNFFEAGERFLKPLTLKQIADEVGIHESTVSRSINGKYMQCSRGVFELKYFFTSGVISDDGSGISSNSIKSMIREIIEGENPKSPYSDQKIADMLGTEGIEISRRTVAKYRDETGILSSSKRRRF